jgi:hypothetical protein
MTTSNSDSAHFGIAEQTHDTEGHSFKIAPLAATDRADDTEAHILRVGVADHADDTEGHSIKHPVAEPGATGSDVDTEGHSFKWEPVATVDQAQDTEGHQFKFEPLAATDRADDTEAHSLRIGVAEQTDDTEGHSIKHPVAEPGATGSDEDTKGHQFGI